MSENKLISFIKVIRPINLIVIALMMYFLRNFIFLKWINFETSTYLNNYMELQISSVDFFLLVLSVISVAAGGYIINDYFDLRADRINKPHRVIIGKIIKRRVAMGAHVALNTVGIAIGFYIAWKYGNWRLGFFNVFASIVLWFYSTNLKRNFLVGNVAIAVLAALIPIIVAMFEVPLLYIEYSATVQDTLLAMRKVADPNIQAFTNTIQHAGIFFNVLYLWAGGYMLFAFVTTLVREIQKDMADIEGDKKVGCRTLPIVMGLSFSKHLVALLVTITAVSLYYIVNTYIVGFAETGYIVIAVVLPLITSVVFTYKAHTRKGYLLAANIMKLAMFTAIFFMFVATNSQA